MEGTPQSPVPGNEADETRKEISDRFGPKLEEAQARLREANERVKDIIKENPGSCLLGAAVLGFAIGRWASRDE